MGVLLTGFLILHDPTGFLSGDWRDLLTVAGVSFTFFGFVIAIWQIRRVASSARAALSATQSTRQELSKNLQLTDLSSAIGLITEIKAAAASKQYDAVRLRLDDLRQRMVQIRAARTHDVETEKAFQVSVTQLGMMESALLERGSSPGTLPDAMSMYSDLRQMSDFLNDLATRTRLETGGTDANS